MGVVKKCKRVPSLKIANARLAKAQAKRAAIQQAKDVDAKHRKSGGYGKKVVSCWEVPIGGIKNSPAYRLVVSRCGGGKLPSPENRAGAPVKGGFPLHKYPPNILVDGMREAWLPDDWAQAVKNTGPGGTYKGWVGPEGKFYYHKCGYPSAIEETIGRKLSALDGFNGIMRAVRLTVKEDADKVFLRECLTNAERKLVIAPQDFHFAVISARRATSVSGTKSIMVVEAQFQMRGIHPTWYVDEASLDDYKKLGLKAVVGGKLTPARNKALDDAKKKGLVCVQVSDDISKWEYLDCQRQDFRGEANFKKANAAVRGARRHTISPVAAAQFLLAKMRASPGKPKLSGVFPTANASLALGTDEYSLQHFILGDFFVADSSTCRFDESMTLKEDYDFTCAHIDKHGGVLRCNRLFVYARHSTNEGGAVATRDGSGVKERQNIAILQKKWPGVFRLNGKRKDEVLMNWSKGETESAGHGKKRKATEVEEKHEVKKIAKVITAKHRFQAIDAVITAIAKAKVKATAAGYGCSKCRWAGCSKCDPHGNRPAARGVGKSASTKKALRKSCSSSKKSCDTKPDLVRRIRVNMSASAKIALRNTLTSWKSTKADWKPPVPPAGWPEGAYPDPSAWVSWLPEDWTPAVQVTNGAKIRRCYISPEKKRFFHKVDIEKALKRKLTCIDGGSKPMHPLHAKDFPSKAKLKLGTAVSGSAYIQKRCVALVGKTVAYAMASYCYMDTHGKAKKYSILDLKYDVTRTKCLALVR